MLDKDSHRFYKDSQYEKKWLDIDNKYNELHQDVLRLQREERKVKALKQELEAKIDKDNNEVISNIVININSLKNDYDNLIKNKTELLCSINDEYDEIFNKNKELWINYKNYT